MSLQAAHGAFGRAPSSTRGGPTLDSMRSRSSCRFARSRMLGACARGGIIGSVAAWIHTEHSIALIPTLTCICRLYLASQGSLRMRPPWRQHGKKEHQSTYAVFACFSWRRRRRRRRSSRLQNASRCRSSAQAAGLSAEAKMLAAGARSSGSDSWSYSSRSIDGRWCTGACWRRRPQRRTLGSDRYSSGGVFGSSRGSAALDVSCSSRGLDQSE